MLFSKDEVAARLAEDHYASDPGMQRIYRLNASSPDTEARDDEPIKLLEINDDTIPSGIQPICFGASPASGIPFSSIIVEVTSEEFKQIEADELSLPDGWVRGKEYPAPSPEPSTES